ncbi:MAG: P-loop NTPase [Firmicutes bacterium]|nr:P-loop NTPase [Bacillota bacterium]
MKELLVISGKGGTGKTSFVGSFAALAQDKVLADCDVDAANLHLLLKPRVKERYEFYGLDKAYIDPEKCTECGKCLQLCRFNAISNFRVDPIGCEGCQVCYYACEEGAIEMRPNLSGYWFVSETAYGPLIHAKLGLAEENSGKLVSKVRQAARELAERQGYAYVLVDGPPGLGCPVISSLTGVDLALIITEPSVAGLHDLERLLGLCNHFKVPTLVCINKWDLAPEISQQVEEFCRKKRIRVAGKVPFDDSLIEASIQGEPVVIRDPESKASKNISSVWDTVLEALA